MNTKKKTVLDTVTDVLFWLAGTFLYALSVQVFVAPNALAAGGVTGIATTINYLFPVLPTGVLIFAINIPLFIISWIVFGRQFIIRTIIATAMNSVFVDVIPQFVPAYEGEKLIAALFGGLLCGIGLGLVFRHGATTGGMDIATRLVRLKLPHISTGTMTLLLDFCVILFAGLCYRSVDSVLYSVIVIFMSGKAMDSVIAGMGHGRMLMIVSDHPQEITADINNETGRGVSLLPVQGGFTGDEKKMLLCVVRAHEVAKVRKIVKRYDEKPFIIITESSEVLGLGFKDHNETL